MSGLKYNGQTPKALKFNAPLLEEEYDFNFLEDWTLNPDNSAGVTVTKNTITVTKVKPKTWFIRSNYGFATATDRNDRFMNKEFRLSGLQALWTSGDITVSTDNPLGDTSQNYQPVGLIISPIKSDGTLLSHVYPWDMNIPNGSFKHVYGYAYGQSWNVYGYGYDEQRALYNYACGRDEYPEVAFAFWTGTTPEADGYLVLDSPFVISLENYAAIDVTTIEGFDAKYISGGNGISLHHKDRTYDSILTAYGFSHEETGTYTETIQGSHDAIVDVYRGQHKAFVISGRDYDKAYDPTNPYEHLRLPAIIDFADYIRNGFPFKYWARLTGDMPAPARSAGSYTHSRLDVSLVEALENTPITSPTFGNHFFSKASSFGRIYDVSMTFDVGAANVIDITSIFDYSDFSQGLTFKIKSGRITSLHNAFRQSQTLMSVVFKDENNQDKNAYISEFTGAFEGAAMTSFPRNVCPPQTGTGLWYGDTTGGVAYNLSEPVCKLHYAADNSKLTTFGNYKDEYGVSYDDRCYTAVVCPLCVGMFARSNITTVKYILDMKFVSPELGKINEASGNFFNAMFGSANGTPKPAASKLQYILLKNLNKGDWYFDGTCAPDGSAAGYLKDIDGESVNYLMANVFDLRKNTDSSYTKYFETPYNSFNTWTDTIHSNNDDLDPCVRYLPGGNSVSKNFSSPGTITFKVDLSDSRVSFTSDGNTETITVGGVYTRSVSGQTSFTSSGPVTVTLLVSGSTSANQERFKSELTSGLSSATIHLPEELYTEDRISLLDPIATQNAIDCGWTLQVGATRKLAVNNGAVVTVTI